MSTATEEGDHLAPSMQCDVALILTDHENLFLLGAPQITLGLLTFQHHSLQEGRSIRRAVNRGVLHQRSMIRQLTRILTTAAYVHYSSLKFVTHSLSQRMS